MKVFVSATSKDLKHCRLLVRDRLIDHGILPVLQDHFPPDYRDLVEYRRNEVCVCDAVICLVGKIHGAAPEVPSGSRSYTQSEYDIAKELDTPVFAF